jgi:hypothetical protein
MSSNHRVVSLWWIQTLAITNDSILFAIAELLVDNVISHGFDVSIALHHVVTEKPFKAKFLRQKKTVPFFNSKAFFNALSHTLELHEQHTKPLHPRQESVVSLCAISAF